MSCGFDNQGQWEGARSSKFGRTKLLIPHKATISNGFNAPHEDSQRGKKHFLQLYSPQKTFKSSIRVIPKIEHWHPRETKKKIVDVYHTIPHPRRQRSHVRQNMMFGGNTAGIRTFYNTRIKENNSYEYAVEDRMQRKQRVNLTSLKKAYIDAPSKTFI